MRNDLGTILVVGDAPSLTGYDMVCKFLSAGYRVRASGAYVYEYDIKGIVLRNPNFSEIEYNIRDEKKIKEIISGCSAVLYLTFIPYDNSVEINLNTNKFIEPKNLKLLTGISKNCGIQQFIYATIPVVNCDSNDLKITENIQKEEVRDYYCHHNDSCIEFFKGLAVDGLSVTLVNPFFSDDFTQNKLDLSISKIMNQTIFKTRIRLFGDDKKQVPPAKNIRCGVNIEKCDSYAFIFHIEGIFDFCLYALEHSTNIDGRNSFLRGIHQFVLRNFWLGRYVLEYLRNPRIPGWGMLQFIGRAIHRIFDVGMMMFLLHVWPEQVYRFSTRKLLPRKSERLDVNERPTIPFELIKKRTSKIQRMKEVNVVMRGISFDLSKLNELKGPTYLVNFDNSLQHYDNNYDSIETREDFTYMSGKIGSTHRLATLGKSVCQVEGHRFFENGEIFFNKGYLDINWYEELLDKPNFKRIAVAERIGRPFKDVATTSWRTTGAGMVSLCALSFFADKINVYGWDYYLKESPSDMTYWQLIFNLGALKLDVFRSRLHFECGIINYYYAYHISKLSNVDNYGYLGQLEKHKKLIDKIERVLFNAN